MPDHLTRPEETLVLKGSHRGVQHGGGETHQMFLVQTPFEAGANVSGRNSRLHQSIIRVGTMERAWKCCHLPRRSCLCSPAAPQGWCCWRLRSNIHFIDCRQTLLLGRICPNTLLEDAVQFSRPLAAGQEPAPPSERHVETFSM